MPDYSYAISPVIAIALSSVVVYYLYSLERLGCQCSLTGKRSYILGFNIFHIAFNIFILALGGTEVLAALYAKYPLLYLVLFGLVIATVINVAFTIDFVNDMKREKCACSDSIFRDIMYILSIIQAVTWSILGLVIIVMGGLVAKDFATGKITMKNIEIAQKAYKKGLKK